jgi:tRNA 2-thiocytidine biosynthesis protein TtcA
MVLSHYTSRKIVLSDGMSIRREQLESNKLQKRLRRNVGKAVADYRMIEEGDRIMVCLSGGKDSYAMLDILMNLQKNAPIQFELVAVNLDQKQPGFPEQVLPNYLDTLDIEYHILERYLQYSNE